MLPKMTDPVCGMSVDPSSASDSTEHKGQAVYFCSRTCRDKFESNPDRYVGTPSAVRLGPQQAASARRPAEQYVCPMHPDVRLDSAGACPKCGMALERRHLLRGEKTQYSCPMHPEIVRDEPGICPVCGMGLEPMVVSATDEAS